MKAEDIKAIIARLENARVSFLDQKVCIIEDLLVTDRDFLVSLLKTKLNEQWNYDSKTPREDQMQGYKWFE